MLISFPMSIQERIISANLNSSMLMNFLMGIYTLIYAETMFIYISRKSEKANCRIVLSAISVLYLLSLMQFAVQWYSLNVNIVIDGDTRESMFFASVGAGPQWISTLGDFLTYSSIIVSDGLMIWRCFNVWGRSLRVIALPLLLVVAEIGLFVAVMILQIKFTQISNNANNNLFNIVSSALVFVALVTTMLTTFLIGYRIHSSSRSNGLPAKRLFAHIVTLVVESSAIYSILLLAYAILIEDPAASRLESRAADAEFYVQTILVVVSGMAPTVLVARISLADPNAGPPTAITHISGLNFGSQHQNSDSQAGIDGIIGVGDEISFPIVEVKRGSSLQEDLNFGPRQSEV